MSTTLSEDRATFTFANGHHCRMPRSARHLYLCTYHARKEAQAKAAQQVGLDLAASFSRSNYLSACDLSSALAHLMSAVAQGHLKPKTAIALAYLSRTLLQSIQLSRHEYINAFGAESWREEIRTSFARPSSDTSEEIVEPELEDRDFQPLPVDAATYAESTLAKLYQNK
jgi:hypothetical protein